MNTTQTNPTETELSRMQSGIRNQLDQPALLETMYRKNKSLFREAFNLLYPDIRESQTAQVWNERLNYETDGISWGSRNDLIFFFTASFLAGLIAKIPHFTGMDEDYFYPRNLGFVVFPFLTTYFAWKHHMPVRRLLAVGLLFILSAIYINVLPDNEHSDTLILACMHLPLLLWSALALGFAGDQPDPFKWRLDFLRYNGDLVVMSALILIAGGLLTAFTFGLFSLIDIDIESIYSQYIGIWGLAAVPLVATYLVRNNPQLVNKISPVIAAVFTPLVLATLLVFLVSMLLTGKDPYNDREFLLMFNVLLIGVMALIFFSVSAMPKNTVHKARVVLLLGLSAVTIVVNGIALSAILFRISEWGWTPNRIAVLGSNVLILTNLLEVAYRLFKILRDENEMDGVAKSMTAFLPVYTAWATLVIFLFPLLFGFK
ncbi:MAG TPA: hypothetical protein VFX48_08995 [Saprospiraceae bacterium]|nr:hypothetical protein [Saprospiraceae bacterium]